MFALFGLIPPFIARVSTLWVTCQLLPVSIKEALLGHSHIRSLTYHL